MRFELIDLGGSRSVAAGDALLNLAATGADTTLVIGGDAQARARALGQIELAAKRLVLVELGTECLAFHTGEDVPVEEKVLGFACFRLGALPASVLVELVRQPRTSAEALAAAQGLFEQAGLQVSVCADVPGRIVDSLLRPYLNSALRGVDEGLATAADLDQALCLGLGYPKGPIQLLEESGLEAHFQVCSELHEATGAAAFVPARRARVLAMRKAAGLGRREA
ncbi:MAG: 3-hydroxyacyl-CoA dehydrogenase [Betaproteobacteria bacterium]|nr:3-hydroxyacyl-CoA dehydrogenase [Betaproteobacteria bacterium]